MSAERRIVGILGGMGPAATVDFYRRIVDATDARRDQDHLHILIDSRPGVPDRTAFLTGQGDDPTPALVAMARGLERAGAQMLVIACNTANVFAPQVADAVRIPIIEWAAEAARGITQSQRGIRTVGLLATTGTIRSRLYQNAFAPHAIDVITPPPPEQDRVLTTIYGPAGVKSGAADLHAARQLVRGVGSSLAADGAEALLLACTELSYLFPHRDPTWAVPMFDAAQIVAERVIVLAGGKVRDHASVEAFSSACNR
jgi:aspartate racemase